MISLATPCFATDKNAGKPSSPEEKFAAMDANGDHTVSREEFNAFYPQMHEAAFNAIDTSADGVLSLEEWLAFSQGHSRDMKATGMGGMGMGGMPPASQEQPKQNDTQLLMPGDYNGGKTKTAQDAGEQRR